MNIFLSVSYSMYSSLTCKDSSDIGSSFFWLNRCFQWRFRVWGTRGSPLYLWWLIRMARPWRGCRIKVRMADDSMLQNCCGTAYLQEIWYKVSSAGIGGLKGKEGHWGNTDFRKQLLPIGQGDIGSVWAYQTENLGAGLVELKPDPNEGPIMLLEGQCKKMPPDRQVSSSSPFLSTCNTYC